MNFRPPVKTNPIKDFRDSFAAGLFRRSGVCASGVKRQGVWWIVRDGDWYRPCWIFITQYSPGCIRIRSDIDPGLPKTSWPHAKPDAGGAHKFELTFHETELTKDTQELIFGCCSVRDFQFTSPLFSESGEIPHYAWTRKGEQHYNDDRKRRGI